MKAYRSMDRRTVLGIGLGALFAASLPARAATGMGRVKLFIGGAPGNASDTVGRALAVAAQALDPALQVEIENRRGAAGELALQVALSADADPHALYLLPGATIYHALTGSATLDLHKGLANVVGSLGQDRRGLFVLTKLGINSFADLLANPDPLIVPTVEATANSYIESRIVNALTGAKLKPVGGYGSPERKLALMSGEAQAVVGSIDTFADLAEQGVLKLVLRLNESSFGQQDSGVPLLSQVAKGPDAELLVGLIAGIALSNTLVVASANVAPAELDRLATFLDDATAKLQTSLSKGLAPIDAAGGDRQTVRQRLQGFFSNEAALAKAISAALA